MGLLQLQRKDFKQIWAGWIEISSRGCSVVSLLMKVTIMQLLNSLALLILAVMYYLLRILLVIQTGARKLTLNSFPSNHENPELEL